jgi:hypothetical protein
VTGETMEEIADRLRAAYDALQAEQLRAAREYPPPEHTSRDPWPEDFVAPGPAVSLRLLAEKAGFTVTMTYARGYTPHAVTGRPGALRHSVAVRMIHPETKRAGVAVYVSPVTKADWSWDTVMIWGATEPFFPYASITDMKDWIKARGEVDARWYTAIRRRLADQAVKAKAARPKGSGRKRGVMS